MFTHDEPHVLNPSPHSPHTKILGMVPAGSRVLDVGCSWGLLAKELKQKNCTVTGVDINEKDAQKAKEYCDQVVMGDIDKIETLPVPDETFDIMLYSDILEHLRYPDRVLKEWKRYLKPSGRIIASIPNIARIEFRLKLLMGRFDYDETGIVSRDHVRFFTKETAQKLVRDCGYEIAHIDYTGLGSMIKILPTLFSFQFIIVGKQV
ncbi:class I SAM-dependent methyltransferase [Elusimicrobiota bacterium]